MKQIKGMTNNNRAEENMEFDNDMVEKIISHLPLKFAIQCKVLSKKYEGVARGVLTLVSIFKKSIVISTCQNGNSNWKVSHILDNFVLGPYDIIEGFPVFIDSKDVYFVVKPSFTENHLYEYDTKTNGYKKVEVLGKEVDNRTYCFHQTLACVHKTPSHNVTVDDQDYIAAKLNDIKKKVHEKEKEKEKKAEKKSRICFQVESCI
ncbi:hypothetical protein H5410_029961 [Solanum commersonii]|uniref:Uncharacterized protein n=1 Tax=Solanum commersonii TaxID=4109 RepID=A0A9J5YFJ7_SOLCO|nr:hypothetical protein H5410_029961 [Solanum commersonii]